MVERSALDGFWLPPGVRLDSEIQERAFGPGRVPVRVPVFTPGALRETLRALKANRESALARRSLEEILASIDEAGRQLTRRDGRYFGELLEVLPELTGYSRRMIEIGLERMGAAWQAPALRATLEDELGHLGVLDDFQARSGGGWQRAYGPRLAVHVFSGNIPGVAVSSLIRALCVKAASFGKTAAGEPYLSVCFARALAEADPGIGSALAVSYWPGGSGELEAVAFSEAEAVVAYGSDAAIADIGCRVPPQVRFLSYPNRVGAGIIVRRALTRASLQELAARAALDVVTFDQQGCVSPHTLYVERGGEVDADDFARALARALEQKAQEIPRGSMSPGESTLIHQVRAQAEMRGATVLASEPGTEWTVIVEDRLAFEASPLNRVIHVRPVNDLDHAVEALAAVGRRLQTVTLAGTPEVVRGLAARLGAIGATRIVPVGEGGWPAPHWHHDGRFQFLDLVRFVDLEV